MRGIRGKDTRPELVIRRGLHSLGFRYRLHNRAIHGTPDLVFPARRAVIFVNGCFWHRHNCHLFKWPKTRKEFWKKKIITNVRNDNRNIDLLRKEEWRILLIWECALKGKTKLPEGVPVARAADWLKGNDQYTEVTGS